MSTCQPATELVKEHWFQNVLTTETHDVDLIIVVGHTPLRNATDSEYDTVLTAIRSHLPEIPIQFFGGHTHIRDFRKFDEKAAGIESGRYVETVGWINLDLQPYRVGRRYIDNNLDSYHFHLGMRTSQEFDTEQGNEISERILRKVVPCGMWI